MRTLILLAWLLVPLAAIAYHYGPGQEEILIDDVGRLLKQGKAQAAAGHAVEAIQSYQKALDMMPDEMPDEMIARQRQVRLETAKLQMISQMLPDAYLELTALVDELRDDPQTDARADVEFAREAQAALANSQYYLTWLLRLEGAPREVWEPEIEAARQTFRELAENVGSQQYRQDLEAVIRLARMDLGELQGLSLPCQCRGCSSGKCKGKGKCKCKGKSKGQGQKKKKDARGASSGPPPDGSGS